MRAMRLSRFLTWRPGLLARNILGSTGWMGLRVLIMGVYFVALARLFGPADYGLLTTGVALASILGPLTGLGLSPLIVLHGSRDPQHLSGYCGKFLTVWLISVPLLCVFAGFLWYWFLSSRIGIWVMFPLVFAELVFMPLLGAIYHALQAKEIIVPAFRVDALIASLRLVAVLVLLWLDLNEMSVFAWLYLLSVLVGLIFGAYLYRARVGSLFSLVRPTWADFVDAGAFLLLDLKSRAAGALDKLFLLNMHGAQAVGLYSAGLRVIEAATLPFQAFLRSVAPRLFRRQNGVDSGPRASLGIVVGVISVLGLLVAVAIYLLAPFLPVLLGHDWSESVDVVRWLALFPLLYGLHHTLLVRVVGIASPGTRLGIELIGLLVGVLAYVLLIPGLGILGAVFGQIASHVMVILLATAFLLRHQQRALLGGAGSGR